MFKKILLSLIVALILGCTHINASTPKPNVNGYMLMYNGYPYPGNILFEYRTTTVFTLPNQNPNTGVYLDSPAIINACAGQTACVINLFIDFQHKFIGDITIDATKGRVVSTNSQFPDLKFYNNYYLCVDSPIIPCRGEKKTR